MVYNSRKWSAVLCDGKVKEYLLGSEFEECLLDLAFDSENGLDSCALLDVVNDSIDDDDDI